MCHQAVLFSCAVMLVLSANLENLETNVNASAGFQLAISKVESRLNLASKMLETARTELRNDMKQLCQSNSCTGNFGCNKWRSSHAPGKPMDCSDIYNDGYHTSGIYQIWPQSKISNGPVVVYCDMEDGGGWTVIQRRGEFGNSDDYFYLEWNDYKTGFGHLLREFWIGNDNLFSLTNQKSYQLKVDLTDWEQNSKYAIYQEFWIDDEVHDYILQIKGYNGTAGDSMQLHNGRKFTTKDRDNDLWNDGNCAEKHQAAWWCTYSRRSSLNGLYLRAHDLSRSDGVQWFTFNRNYNSLKDSVMKIRPAGFTGTRN